jgi:HSP20 family protein
VLVRRVWPSRPTFESPFADFDLLRQQMLRLFDVVGGNTFGELDAGVFPPMNITQDADNFYVRAEIPGTRAKDLEITATGRKLSISGKREIPKENGHASYHRRERAEGEFNRTLTLPADFDPAHVEAKYEAGILTVSLPKSEAAKPKQIVVRT